jgi:Reverse transcriptase (RNA-dependent DNA polymerase)
LWAQLILSVDDWAKSLDDGLQTDIAIVDFSKAFDSVPHYHLLVKVENYGIRGNTLKWISAFIHHHTERVILDGCQFSWLNVTSSVLQSTVLAPLFFFYYTTMTLLRALHQLSDSSLRRPTYHKSRQ